MPRWGEPRPIRVEGDVAYVELTQGLESVLDAEDVDKVSGGNWSPTKSSPHTYYAQRQRDGKTVYLHRIIMDAPKGVLVDHKDGDGLNNRKINLRLTDRRGNAENRKEVNANNISTGERNICRLLRKSDQRWVYKVQLRRGGVDYRKDFPDTDLGLEAAREYVRETLAQYETRIRNNTSDCLQ